MSTESFSSSGNNANNIEGEQVNSSIHQIESNTKEPASNVGVVPVTYRRNKILLIGLLAVIAAIAIGLGVGLSSNSTENSSTSSRNSAVEALGGEGFCGGGFIGNGTCQHGLCCSAFGFCGFEPEFCIDGQVLGADVLSPDRFCGQGLPGNGTCANSTECCSSQGQCGLSYYHCGYWPVESPASYLPDGSLRTEPPCGDGIIGDGTCEKEGECCSMYGYCANTPIHCENSVQNTGNEADVDDTNGNGLRFLR